MGRGAFAVSLVGFFLLIALLVLYGLDTPWAEHSSYRCEVDCAGKGVVILLSLLLSIFYTDLQSRVVSLMLAQRELRLSSEQKHRHGLR